ASIENHGPYNKTGAARHPELWNGIELPGGLNDAAALEWRNYLYHLQNSDRELTRLLEYMHARQRPFVVAMFGDHLPALGKVYDAMGMGDGRSPRAQTVPWVIVSSR